MWVGYSRHSQSLDPVSEYSECPLTYGGEFIDEYLGRVGIPYVIKKTLCTPIAACLQYSTETPATGVYRIFSSDKLYEDAVLNPSGTWDKSLITYFTGHKAQIPVNGRPER